MIKAVFIDIDNTILSFDAYVKNSLSEGFEKFGIGKYDDSVFEVFNRENRALWLRIEDGSLTIPKLRKIRFNIIFSALSLSFDGVEFEKYFSEQLSKSAIPEEGAIKLLEYLSKKYMICCASNGPYGQQKGRLSIANMLGYFDHLFISEDIGYSKPSNDFFRTAFERLNEGKEKSGLIYPDETMMIGDSLTSDIKGGKDYKMKTCFYNRSKETLLKDTADHIVTSLDEIITRGIL